MLPHDKHSHSLQQNGCWMAKHQRFHFSSFCLAHHDQNPRPRHGNPPGSIRNIWTNVVAKPGHVIGGWCSNSWLKTLEMWIDVESHSAIFTPGHSPYRLLDFAVRNMKTSRFFFFSIFVCSMSVHIEANDFHGFFIQMKKTTSTQWCQETMKPS